MTGKDLQLLFKHCGWDGHQVSAFEQLSTGEQSLGFSQVQTQWEQPGNTDEAVQEACADIQPDSDSSGSSANTVVPKSTPSASPATVTPGFTGSADVTTNVGCTFNVSYNVHLGTPTSDISNSQPGYTEIDQTASGTVTITNTTAGRNIDQNDIGVIVIVAHQPSDSVVCKDNLYSGCDAAVGSVILADSIAAGGSETLTLQDNGLKFGYVPEADDHCDV